MSSQRKYHLVVILTFCTSRQGTSILMRVDLVIDNRFDNAKFISSLCDNTCICPLCHFNIAVPWLTHILGTAVACLRYRHAILVRVSCISETTAALGAQDPNSLGVGLPFLQPGRNRVMNGGIGMHWTKMNTHVRT